MLNKITTKKCWIPPTDYDEWQDMVGSPLDDFYTKSNTKHKQRFDYAPDYIKEFADKKFLISSFSVIEQQPGNFIPYHYDKYSFFMDQHNIKDITKILRFNIFLEDWKPGHYFDVEDVPILHWSAGQYIPFNHTIRHGSANAGTVPKYTCQVTGILK